MSVKLSTEFLLIDPVGFGIATATPAQRAACRIIDGLPLGDLRDHPDVAKLVGGPDAINALPSELGVMPSEVVFLAAIRSAKTLIAVSAALRAALTCDLSRLVAGEVPRVSLVSIDLDKSAVAFGQLTGVVQASSLLSRLIQGMTKETLTLRHPSGRLVEIACVAGAKAGGGLVARWSAGAVFDEAPRMAAASDGSAVNLDDMRTAVLGRLLPGSQALYIGSPWAPTGTVYALTDQHFGKPSKHMVVLRGNGPMLNPTWWTPERCEDLRIRNPTAYTVDVEGNFADPEAGLLSFAAVKEATREGPLVLAPERHTEYFAAVDPSEGSAKGNGFSLVIIEKALTEQERMALRHNADLPRKKAGEQGYRVTGVWEWRGLTPGQCWVEIGKLCSRYGITTVRTDQYAASANADLAKLVGIRLVIDKTTAASKLEDYTNLATIVHSGQLEIAPDETLRRDLLSIKRRVTPQGAQIVLPGTSDGRHADFASALVAALKSAANPPQEIRPFKGKFPGF